MAKLHKTAYAIRKGFEYQDLYCARHILRAIALGSWNDRFKIESDEVLFIDDLEIIRGDSDRTNHQVKFHTTQEHEDSIATLTEQKSPRSRSLIQKLHVGWARLSLNGEQPCVVRFVSSNAASQKLRRAIDTADGRLNDKFWCDSAYGGERTSLSKHLGLDSDALRSFLSNVRWKFGYRSIAELKEELQSKLQQVSLPHDTSALESVLGLVGWVATEYRSAFSAAGFLQWLSDYSIFREAIEDKYADTVPGLRSETRATIIRIGIISLQSLPTCSNNRIAGLEEASPPTNWDTGLTDPCLAEVVGGIREVLREEYERWFTSRLEALLHEASASQLDLLVFPRYTLPLSVAAQVARWCAENHCNAAIGGYRMPATSREAMLQSDLNLPDRGDDATNDSDATIIVDPILRFDRKGRVCLSKVTSPYDKDERIIGELTRCQLGTRTGWIQVVMLPSLSAVNAYARDSASVPDELVICPIYAHRELILHTLDRLRSSSNTPFVISAHPSDTRIIGVAGLLRQISARSYHEISSDWEGVTVIQIEYARGVASDWSAQLRCEDRIPLVYTGEARDTSERQELSGLPESVTLAKQRAPRRPRQAVATVQAEKPSEFFARRCFGVAKHLRELLGSIPSDLLPTAAAVVKSLEDDGGRLDPDGDTRSLPCVSKPDSRVSGLHPPRMVGRAEEHRQVSRFLDRSSSKRVLIVHGYAGLGKRTILRNVQETDMAPSEWRWLRCVPNATMEEFCGQILMRLGLSKDPHPPLGYETYTTIAKGIAAHRVAVLEEGWNLPIAQDQTGHGDLMELLQVICDGNTNAICKIIIVSEWAGHLQFSGSHLLDTLPVRPLQIPDTEQLLQHLLSIQPLRHARPSAKEVGLCAQHTRGWPILAELLTSLLREIPVAEVLETFHQRREVRRAILEHLLHKSSLTPKELQFLHFASVFRVPVSLDAFTAALGTNASPIIAELKKRQLLLYQGGRVELHPLLRDHFLPDAERTGDIKRFHAAAARYFDGECTRRPRDVDARIERVYHSLRGGVAIDISEMRACTTPLRSLILEGVGDRDWPRVNEAADRLLDVFEHDAVAKIAKSLALDAEGDPAADDYFDSVSELDRSHLWLAVEFARSKIRRRSFMEAERILGELEHRHANDGRVLVGWLRLQQARGEDEQAITTAERIFSSSNPHWRNVFEAGLALRRMHRLDRFVAAIEARDGDLLEHPPVRRLYALGCVLTGHDPDEGIRLLHDHWYANRSCGYATADYGAALVSRKRFDDAARVLRDGLDRCRNDRRGLPALRSEYARFLSSREVFLEAHEQFRELLRRRSPDLYVYREFATSLWTAAQTHRASGDRAAEDSAIREAEDVLRKLTTIAPGDTWASDMLHRVQSRAYANG